MIRGLATIDAYRGVPSADSPIVAQWLSLASGWASLCLRPSQGQPLVYLESHLSESGYRSLLTGGFDRRLHEIRDCMAWAPDAIPRWDHEMDGPRNEWRTWGQMDPEVYVAGFRHVASILGPMHWCPTSVWERWEPYFPGVDVVSHVGFDFYFRERLRPFQDAWRRRIAECERLAPGVPILVGETASAKGLRGRLAHLRTLDDVAGVWGVCWFDVDRTGHEGVDWTMTPAMRRVYER